MAWLLAHMWVALAGVAVFGLLLGWSIRGMLLVNKMRKAVVERDVTMTELDQAREEIESLYAAQRGQPVGNFNPREAQAEQNVKLQRLTDELARAKSELETLKTKADEAERAGIAKAGVAAAASAAGTLAAVGGASDPNPALVWRNRHLESRVRHLEGMLDKGEQGVAAVETAVPAAVPAAASDVSESEQAKAEWQHNFLKQRVEALETELAQVKMTPEAPAEVAAAPAAQDEVDEELARLRWRNRYLEGRLAYFEGDQDAREEAEAADAESAEDETDSAVAPLVDLPEAEAEAEPETVDEEAPLEATETVEPENEPEAEPEPVFVEAEAEMSEPEEDPDDIEEAQVEAEDQVEFDTPALEAEDDEAETEFAEAEFDTPEFEDDAEDEVEPEAEPSADPFGFTAEDVLDVSEPQAPEEVAADPDAEVDLPTFEIEDRFPEEAPVPVMETEAGDDAEDEADEDAEESAVATPEEASRAILAALELDDDEDADAETDLDADAADEDDSEADEADDAPRGVRPIALDKPVENSPDDLTEIGGIGPKIQELLNAMGVWHYDQIAAWTPDNVVWVDHELNFSGRIVREGWVQQAAILAGDTVDEDA